MPLVDARGFQLTPNALGAVRSGLQGAGQIQQLQGTAQQRDINNQTRQLSGMVMDTNLPPQQRIQAQQQLSALNPQAAQQLQQVQTGQAQQFSAQDTVLLKSIAEGAIQVQSLPNDESKLAFLNRRKIDLQNQGRPTAETDEVIGLYEAGRVDEANALIDKTVTMGEKLGFIKAPSVKGAFKQQEIDIKLEGLKLRQLENEARVDERKLTEETNVLRRKELELKIEEKRKKIDQKQKDIIITAQQAVDSTNSAIDAVDRLLAHPGLESAVGTSSLLPSLPGTDRANFEAELESFDAKLFSSAIKQMKGMGSLSDAEGRKVSAAVGAINQKMTEEAFKESLNIIKTNFERARQRTEAQLPAQELQAQPQAPALPQGVTEDDITETMRTNNMTREQVLQRLQGQ